MNDRDILIAWIKDNIESYRAECQDDEDVVEYLVMDGPSETGVNLGEDEIREIVNECVTFS